MKIRSLLLGSVAAAGLSTGGAFAADLGVLPSFDICDELGLSGLTISSETNCLVITGEVSYEFEFGGDFSDADEDGDEDEDDNDYRYTSNDLEAWIQFASSSSTDFGKATAVIKLTAGTDYYYYNGADDEYDYLVGLDQAYVSIGDGTVFTAGLTDSIGNFDDDEPLDWLGGFISEDVDAGVYGPDWGGGLALQVTHDLGNGFSIAGALENLLGDGTAVGVLEYAGDDISAHVTVEATPVFFDYDYTDWGVHAGFTGTFDAFKTVLAGSFQSFGIDGDTEWNVLASASYDLDMFTLAGAVEAYGYDDGDSFLPDYSYTGFGVSGSVSAEVSEGVTLNVGGRYAKWDYTDFLDEEEWEVAVGVTADVTETLEVEGKLGYAAFQEDTFPVDDVIYGELGLTWNPDGDDGYEASLTGKLNSDSEYSITTNVSKTFE